MRTLFPKKLGTNHTLIRNIHNIIITGNLNADDYTRDGAKLAFLQT